MDFFLIVGLGATVVPALLAFILNLFNPETPPRGMAWLAASVAPVLIAIYTILFIAAGLVEPHAPLPMSEIVTGLALDVAVVLGTLVVGYLVARLLLSFLRRR